MTFDEVCKTFLALFFLVGGFFFLGSMIAELSGLTGEEDDQ